MSEKNEKPFLGRKHHDFDLLARRSPCLRAGDVHIVRACFLVDSGNYDERRGYVKIIRTLHTDDSGRQVSFDLQLNKKRKIANLYDLSRSSNGYLCVQGLLTITSRGGTTGSKLLLLDERDTKWIPSANVPRSGHRKKCRKLLSKWKPDTEPVFTSVSLH